MFSSRIDALAEGDGQAAWLMLIDSWFRCLNHCGDGHMSACRAELLAVMVVGVLYS